MKVDQLSYSVSPQDVYPGYNSHPKLLETIVRELEEQHNVRFVAFRPPRVGEQYLGVNYILAHAKHSEQLTPRFIFERVKHKVVEFRSTGEVRLARIDEWFYNGGSYCKAWGLSSIPYEIFTMTEREE